MKRRSLWLAILAVGLLILSACTSGVTVKLDHVHGLGFSPDGSQVLIAAHDGIKVYQDGKWAIPDQPKNDYMGFVATDDGFYSSGHPGPGVKLPEPLGLVKSTDGGKTLKLLGLQGQYDFHVMGAGYKSHAVYVFNQVASPQLPAGLQFSLDDGKSWKKAGAKGLSGAPIQIAVHPTDVKIVAVGTEHGLFLSMDQGESFAKLWERSPVPAVTFAGERLLFGFQGLAVYELATKQLQELKAPVLAAKDAIGYVAVQGDRVALATYGNEVYLSSDGGKGWKQIVKQGKGQ